PLERLEYMIEDAGIGVIVSGEKESERLPAGVARVVNVEEERDEIGGESEETPEEVVGGEHIAYVMYTSGSTGEPKGVEVLQRGVVRLVEGVEYAELGEEEVVLQGSSSTFDASTFEIWGALLRGGRLVMMEEKVAGVERVRRAIEEEGVTTMWLTSTLFNAIVEEGAEALRGLRQLLVGGEALSVKHIRKAKEEWEGTRLINGYGPTEGTTFTCTYEIGEVGEGGQSIAIGGGITNTRVYVLGERGEVVPEGVVGELYIGGDGLGRGYVGRAGETGEKFVPDEYGGGEGERLYRTGDLVRYGLEGRIEYVGRRDHQVKVRGYRIEIREIERAVLGYGGVKEAAVVVKEEGIGKRLVGYVVMEDGEERQVSEIREYLKERLPEYMVPGEWVKLEEMPVTSGGKVDRQKLKEMEKANDRRGEYVEPRSEA